MQAARTSGTRRLKRWSYSAISPVKQQLKAIDAFERGKKGLKPADFRPGNDACQWCRFAEPCNAKRRMAGGSLDDKKLESDLSDDSTEMTLDQLKAEW